MNKNQPTDAWLTSLRERFPCEPEVDRFLARKLTKRAGPGYVPISLQALCGDIEKLLNSKLNSAFEIDAPRWLTGGASKLQMAFELK